MRAYTSKYIFDGEQLLTGKIIFVDDNNKIVDIVNNVPANIQIEYLGDGVISPGFIDLQLNGCGGVLFNDSITEATLDIMYQTWQKYGTTGFLPTLITSPFSDVIKALEVCKSWFNKYGNTRGVLGLHLEGPFLSLQKSGIHSKEYIIKPNNDMLQQIVSYNNYFPIKMTIAVEEFTSSQIKYLVDNGIIISIGHSNASYNVAIESINLGIKTATHMFNAMSGLTGRNPGVIGAVLNSEIYTGLIVDMLHVDVGNVELLNKVKNNQVYLVTDAVTPVGTSMLDFKLAGKQLYVKDGKCVDIDGVLGGAYLTMNDGIKNIVKYCHIDLATAIKMATLIPLQVLGLDHEMGRIKVNYRADLVYMDLDTYQVKIIK